MHYYLQQITPPNSYPPIEIHITRDEVHVGRKAILTLAKFPQISREHAIFYKTENGNLYVKDSGSLNGVYVNDVKIGTSLKVLKVGDTIGFGITSSEFNEGFVCNVCVATVKSEVIVISDDDEEVVDEINTAVKAFSSTNILEPSNFNKTNNSVERLEHSSEAPVEVKEIVVPLVKCDTNNFQFPPDVKNSFKETDVLKKQRLKTNVKESLTKARESFEGEEHPVTCNKKNVQRNFLSRSEIVTKNNPVHRIKKSDVSCHKWQDIPSTSIENNVPHRFENNSKPVTKKYSNLQEKSEECYSQVDEVIYISDDDVYLDFSSSQNCVNIKKEPEEVEDFEGDEVYKEIFERESNHELECVPNNLECIKQRDFDDKIESIEAIQAFVSKSNSNSATVSNAFENTAEDTDSSSSDHNESSFDNPILDNTSANKGSAKPCGVILTEPKPMTYRPRRLRGRDEGFVEKNKTLSNPKHYKDQLKRRESKLDVKDSRKKSKDSGHEKDQSKTNKRSYDGDLVSSKSSSRPLKIIKQSENIQKEKKHESVKHKISNLCERKERTHNSRHAENQVKTDKSNYDGTSNKIATSNLKISNHKKLQSNINPQIDNSKERDHMPLDFEKSKSRKNIYEKEKSRNQALMKKTVYEKSKESNEYNNLSSSKNIASPTKATTFRSICQNSKEKHSSPDSNKSEESKPKKYKVSNINTGASSVSSYSVNVESNMPGNASNSKITFDGVMKIFLNMNTKWLQEQAKKRTPPLGIIAGAGELPLIFNSYESYASSFFSMITLEIWEYMFIESQEIYKSNKNYKKFYFTVLSYSSLEDRVEIKCESIVNERMCFGPREGVIAILEMKENIHKCSPLFGYIYKHKIEPLNSEAIKFSCWKGLPENWVKFAKKWTFNAYIKKKEMSFQLNTVMKGNGLCYIRTKLRLADALNSIKYSPLLKDILQPKEATFTTNKYQLSPTREYSSSQMEIIRSISDEVNETYLQPKILLLQGPPGTGKTHTIIGLIEKLFYSCKNESDHKILVTAPSDEAIDEIGCRLIELNENSGWRDNDIKFVRVGLEKQIHKKMVPYFVDNKAKDLYMKSSQIAALKEEENQKILSEINKLEMCPRSRDRDVQINHLKERSKNLLSNKPIDFTNNNTALYYKITALKESHIILSTLNSCGMSLLHKTFKPNSSVYFSCCIVDEATQSTELEILQPLVFGMKKLILVGDPEQLPPVVLSKLASQYGFERSLFERFSMHFQRQNRNPVLCLTQQFRMHSAICEFPSKHFYAHKLQTHPDTFLRYKEFPLHPYLVMDFSAVPKSNDVLIYEREAHVMRDICKFVMNLTNSELSVGIIISHQAKCPFYVKAFYRHPGCKQIEINTVDGFRSKEKDVVILSAVNAASHADGQSFLSCKQKLNVAITRARKCLIICVDSVEVISYGDWSALIHDAQERQLFVCLRSSTHVVSALAYYIQR